MPMPLHGRSPLKGESRVLRGLHPLARTNKLSFRDQIVDLNEEKGGERGRGPSFSFGLSGKVVQ
jgi:hypothetical protein